MGPWRHQQRGGPGGIPPGIHTYHPHLQKPERSCFHSFGGTPKARQAIMLLCLLSLCPSRSHVLTSGTPGNGQTLTVPHQKYCLAHSPKSFLIHHTSPESPWRHQQRGVNAQHSHTYHHHLQKPGRSVFITKYRTLLWLAASHQHRLLWAALRPLWEPLQILAPQGRRMPVWSGNPSTVACLMMRTSLWNTPNLFSGRYRSWCCMHHLNFIEHLKLLVLIIILKLIFSACQMMGPTPTAVRYVTLCTLIFVATHIIIPLLAWLTPSPILSSCT